MNFQKTLFYFIPGITDKPLMYFILKGSLCRSYLLKQGLLDGKRQITLGLFLTFRHTAVPEEGGCAVASVPAAPRALPRVSLRKRRATVVLDPVASVAVQGLALPARAQVVGAAWPPLLLPTRVCHPLRHPTGKEANVCAPPNDGTVLLPCPAWWWVYEQPPALCGRGLSMKFAGYHEYNLPCARGIN